MSHSVTITTTNPEKNIIVNAGYLKTVPGILKIAELIIGGFCVFFLAWDFWSYSPRYTELFFVCTAAAFLIGTFCLLASCLVSHSTGGIISKTIYELVYHSVAFIFYLIASILLLVKVSDYHFHSTHPHMMAAWLGLVLSGLYLVSAIMAQCSYRGI